MVHGVYPENRLELNYKDHCLIIVGDGGEADEVLARRRVRAGGRLAHFTVSPDQVTHAGPADDILFSWHPLYRLPKATGLGLKLGPSWKTYWTKSGPDCMKVTSEQMLQIYCRAGDARLVRLVNEEGDVLLEMSGEVVLKPDMDLAMELDVDVQDPELQAFGTFSTRYVLSSFAVLIPFHALRWLVSMLLEVQDETQPWWRFFMVLVSGVLICTPGLWQSWAASLSGERDLRAAEKLLSVAVAIPVVLATSMQVAEVASALMGGLSIFLSGPFVQYYQTRSKHPDRGFGPCLLWTTAQLLGTFGVATVLLGVVVLHGLIFAYEPILASFFLPVSTALVETSMVTFTRLMHINLVIKRRPALPGDVSHVAMPYMLAAIHGLAEAARVVSVFSGAVKSGQYSWIGTLAVTFLVNVLTRCGWSRFFGFCMVRRLLGLARAMIFTPTVYGKLHDEMKIYVGYFRFIVVIALVLARALVYREDGRGAAFNTSAASALISMLLLEVLEDQVVIRQIVPMSPIVEEVIDHLLQDGVRHAGLLSVDLRSDCDSGGTDPWRMQELNEKGFQSSKKMTTLVVPEVVPEVVPDVPPEVGPTQYLPVGRLCSIVPEEGEDGSRSNILAPMAPAAPHPHSLHPAAPPEPDEGAMASEDEARRSVRHSVFSIPPLKRQVSKQSVAFDLEKSDANEANGPQLMASLGQRRSSASSRLRRWFGQQRAVQGSLILHGLREMPFLCQLSAVGIISEATLGFLNTTLGPGFLRGMLDQPCEDFDPSVSLWWPFPLTC